jgi:hypothetical protein
VRKPSVSHPPAKGVARTRRNLLIATAAASALGAAAVLMFSSSSRSEVPYTCGGERVVALDLSSQNRSDQAVGTAVDLITFHTLAAAICDEPLAVVGVAGGRQELIAPHIDFLVDLRRPNPRARANAVKGRIEEARSIVAEELKAVYAAYPDVATTSIPAVFEAAGDQLDGEDDARVLVLSTGVHIDGDLSLNRPLEEGEGKALADQLAWPVLGSKVSMVVVGISQMDGEVPVPGDLWPREVMAFTRQACTLAKAGSCSAYQVAPSEKALL